MNQMMMGMMNQMSMGGGNGGMKPGDWMCGSCGDHQFARNSECRKCGAARSDGGGGKGGKGFGKVKGKKAGDWFCPSCNDLQFAKNLVCRKCQTPNPDPEGSQAAMEAGIAAGHGGQEMKPGDWFCPGCNDLQFAKNKKCRKCQTPNPDPEGSMEAASISDTFKPKDAQQKKPGDWTCEKCGDLQFARNETCRMCGHAGNMGGGNQMMNMMNMMMGGGGKGGGKGGDGGMVQIPAQMLAMLMGGGMAGGGMMGGKGGGKGKGKKYSPY